MKPGVTAVIDVTDGELVVTARSPLEVAPV